MNKMDLDQALNHLTSWREANETKREQFADHVEATESVKMQTDVVQRWVGFSAGWERKR